MQLHKQYSDLPVHTLSWPALPPFVDCELSWQDNLHFHLRVDFPRSEAQTDSGPTTGPVASSTGVIAP